MAAEVAVAEAEEQLLAVELARLRLSRDARKVTPVWMLLTLRKVMPRQRQAAKTRLAYRVRTFDHTMCPQQVEIATISRVQTATGC